jgi:hypothetical protein
LILSIDVVELVLSFPTNLKSTQSKFRWRNYDQNTISALQNSKSTVHNFEITVHNSGTHLLPVLFQLVSKITDRNSKITEHNYWRLEHEFIFWKRLFIRIKRFLHPFVPNISQHSKKLIPSKKKRRKPLEKILEKKNSRTEREIEDLLGVFFFFTLFSCCVVV